MKTHKPKPISTVLLTPAPWNYKVDDASKAQRFRASIEKNGYLYPLVIAQRAEVPDSGLYEVIDGNHRLAVVLDMGLTSVPCFDLGRMPLHERQRVALELNEHRWDIDTDKLGDILQGLQEAFDHDDLLATLPWTEADMQSIIDMTHIDETDGPPADDHEERTEGFTKSGTADVPEVILIFGTHTEFNEFCKVTGYESGQVATWTAIKQGVLDRWGTGEPVAEPTETLTEEHPF